MVNEHFPRIKCIFPELNAYFPRPEKQYSRLRKNAFGELIVDGKIPASASPFYFNKMMELDLINKSRKFQKESTKTQSFKDRRDESRGAK